MLIAMLIADSLLGNLGENYTSVESVVHIIIINIILIIIDKDFDIVDGFLLQGYSRWPQ